MRYALPEHVSYFVRPHCSEGEPLQPHSANHERRGVRRGARLLPHLYVLHDVGQLLRPQLRVVLPFFLLYFSHGEVIIRKQEKLV
jgi:hypothetical protein